jgi:hypothetical protein
LLIWQNLDKSVSSDPFLSRDVFTAAQAIRFVYTEYQLHLEHCKGQGTEDGNFCVGIDYKRDVESYERTLSFKFTIQEGNFDYGWSKKGL